MKPAQRAVGIDLGTTHTVVAFADLDGEAPPQIFPVPQLVTPTLREARPLFPSCLYAPVPGEISDEALALFGDAPWVAGELARRRGGEVPGRLVASAKSWLCHPGVDRDAPILPWGASDDPGGPPRVSPVDASARYLAHVARAWDEAFPGEPLAAAEVVLTVPASFDEVARELTVTAARRAGLSVRLLEEPQAAFYDYMEREGRAGLESLLAGAGSAAPSGGARDAMVLVVDVGGGTTDLSLLRVSGSAGGALEVTRVAVGRHLLLGGDNMDLALAHLCESRLVAPPARLDPGRFGQLVVACRAAKERLLSGASDDESGEREGSEVRGGDASARAGHSIASLPITILGAGARLVGSSLTTELTRAEVERVVLEGFFPREGLEARPPRGAGARSGLVAFGLPYERDVAITRHVAQFFARHSEGAGPSALLLNGGVFRARRLASRLEEAVTAFGGTAPLRLPLADPDLAVARGAVAYARARRGRGLRLGGGLARGYYVGPDAGAGASARRAVCVVPRGAEEGTVHTSAGGEGNAGGLPLEGAEGEGRAMRTFGLVVGRPVRFDLFASDEAQHLPGEIVAVDEERFTALPRVAVTFESSAGASAGRSKGKPEEVRVALEGELTPVGTLDLACVEVGPPAPPPARSTEARRRFRLAFQLRHEDASADGDAAAGTVAGAGGKARAPAPRGRSGEAAAPAGKLEEAREAILRVYGKGRPDVAPREVKDLLRELERLLGERAGWTLATNRALFDALAPGHRSRRRSADHERVFWLLAGYTGRPGFGDPEDGHRIAEVAPLFGEKVIFPEEARGAQQFWIAWRRLAGGLDEALQTRIRDVLDPLLAPTSARLKKPKGWKLEAEWDALDLAAALERIPPARRSELGAWLLERTWTSRDPRLWAALGRIGARVPAYASVHHVIQPLVVERWLDHLLREKWDPRSSAPEAAMQLARVTGDRARDVSERVRLEVAARLEAVGARAEWVRAVRELVFEAEAERAARFGEGLPVGLRLIA